VERALFLQIVARPLEAPAHAQQARPARAGENAGIIDIGDGWPVLSKSSRTITRRSSNRFKAQPLAWAESCATFSPWVRDR